MTHASNRAKSNISKKHKNGAFSVYKSKLPKIKRFINIYQTNGSKGSKRSNAGSRPKNTEHPVSQNVNQISINPIKVDDANRADSEIEEEKSMESSLDVIGISSDVINKINKAESNLQQNQSKFHLSSVNNDSKSRIQTNSNKNTGRIHTITPECPVDTSLPDINIATTTRNTRKALVSHKRIQRKVNALGKPPL